MRFSSAHILLYTLLLSTLSFPSLLLAQKWDSESRDSFCERVNTIVVWTYISEDPGYRYYSDVKEEVILFLNRKMYQVRHVYYDSTISILPADWKQQQVSSLRQNEAFLEIQTLIHLDSVEMAQNVSKRKDQVIMDDRGRAISTIQIHDPVLDHDTSYIFYGNASLYLPDTLAGNDPMLVYSRSFVTQRVDPITIIRRLLSKIPVCKHSIVPESARRPLFQGNVVIEFHGVGGYLFPSSMKLAHSSSISVIEGDVDFDGGISYGAGISFGFTKSLDLKLTYRHEGTNVRINMPVYADSSKLKFQINYILFGADYNFRVVPWFSPFVGGAFGAVQMSPRNQYYREVWYFALNAEAGTKFYINRWLGFRMQAEMFYHVHPKNAPFLFTMYDVTIHEDATSNMMQWGISAGIIFRIK